MRFGLGWRNCGVSETPSPATRETTGDSARSLHYRSYQILGQLGQGLPEDDPVVTTLRRSMDQEVERIFRLMGLLLPDQDLHSAYFGLRSDNLAVRANAIEFLDNVLTPPQLRNLIVPLLDSHVTVEERIELATRLVGAAVETREDAVLALLQLSLGILVALLLGGGTPGHQTAHL